MSRENKNLILATKTGDKLVKRDFETYHPRRIFTLNIKLRYYVLHLPFP